MRFALGTLRTNKLVMLFILAACFSAALIFGPIFIPFLLICFYLWRSKEVEQVEDVDSIYVGWKLSKNIQGVVAVIGAVTISVPLLYTNFFSNDLINSLAIFGSKFTLVETYFSHNLIKTIQNPERLIEKKSIYAMYLISTFIYIVLVFLNFKKLNIFRNYRELALVIGRSSKPRIGVALFVLFVVFLALNLGVYRFALFPESSYHLRPLRGYIFAGFIWPFYFGATSLVVLFFIAFFKKEQITSLN